MSKRDTIALDFYKKASAFDNQYQKDYEKRTNLMVSPPPSLPISQSDGEHQIKPPPPNLHVPKMPENYNKMSDSDKKTFHENAKNNILKFLGNLQSEDLHFDKTNIKASIKKLKNEVEVETQDKFLLTKLKSMLSPRNQRQYAYEARKTLYSQLIKRMEQKTNKSYLKILAYVHSKMYNMICFQMGRKVPQKKTYKKRKRKAPQEKSHKKRKTLQGEKKIVKEKLNFISTNTATITILPPPPETIQVHKISMPDLSGLPEMPNPELSTSSTLQNLGSLSLDDDEDEDWRTALGDPFLF